MGDLVGVAILMGGPTSKSEPNPSQPPVDAPVGALVDSMADTLLPLRRGHWVVVTGAGISLASGIPTFRGNDPGAVWKHDVLEMGTYRFFRQDPVESWRWYLSRFDKVLGTKPNPAHHALVALERWQRERGGRFTLVTQNIDTLHEKAGARDFVKVHGTADRIRCPRAGCEHGAPRGSLPRSAFDVEIFRARPSQDTLPRCPACGEVLRQHVLWFDEFYGEHEDYQWDRVQAAATTMEVLLFVGTSFSVGVTDLFARQALMSRIPVLAIDPGLAAPPYPGILQLSAPAERLLPALCSRLGATWPP